MAASPLWSPVTEWRLGMPEHLFRPRAIEHRLQLPVGAYKLWSA